MEGFERKNGPGPCGDKMSFVVPKLKGTGGKVT